MSLKDKHGNTLKAGDKVILLSGGGEFPLIGYTDGEIYVVDIKETIKVIDEMGFGYGEYGEDHEGGIAITEGKTVAWGYALPEQLEKVSEVEEEEEETSKFSDKHGFPIFIGNWVKLLEGGDSGFLLGFYDGKIYKVTDKGHPTKPTKLRLANEKGQAGFARPENVELVDEADVPTEPPKSGPPIKNEQGSSDCYGQLLKHNDLVKLLAGGGKTPLHGFKNGYIYKVNLKEHCGPPGTVCIWSGELPRGYAKPSQIRKYVGGMPPKILDKPETVEFGVMTDKNGNTIPEGAKVKLLDNNDNNAPLLGFDVGKEYYAYYHKSKPWPIGLCDEGETEPAGYAKSSQVELVAAVNPEDKEIEDKLTTQTLPTFTSPQTSSTFYQVFELDDMKVCFRPIPEEGNLHAIRIRVQGPDFRLIRLLENGLGDDWGSIKTGNDHISIAVVGWNEATQAIAHAIQVVLLTRVDPYHK